jgi:hypothetical protein
MAVSICVAGWLIVMAYVAIGNYLYLSKVLPNLARRGLNGTFRFLPWEQLRQVDLFVAGHPANAPKRPALAYLSHIRLITAITLIAEICAFGAWLTLAF